MRAILNGSRTITVVLRASWLVVGLSLAAQGSPDPLKAVDAFRHPWPAYQVEVSISSKGQAQRWKVLSAEDRNVRVEGLSEREKGRTVLLLGEAMWLLLPNTKKPVRVTPQQRLLGPAAGGDLARSSFADDFQVTGSEETELEGRPCLRLSLAARKPSHSYRTASLWVATGSDQPLKGEFRLPSGKLARTLRFGPLQATRGTRVLSGMIIEEPNGSRSELRFSGWAPAQPDPALFRLP